MAERPCIAADQVSAAPVPVPADRRLVSAEDARIAVAAIDLLAAMVGAAAVASLGDVLLRTVTPTANRLSAALRDAGYDLGAAAALRDALLAAEARA